MFNHRITRFLALGIVFLLAMVGLAVTLLPSMIETQLAGVSPHDRYEISTESKALHADLVVADWHADSLLWKRDLLQRGDRGHVDLPRLRDGNVAIQMFTAVSKSPANADYTGTRDAFDLNTPLAMVNLWPPGTWGSLLARVLHQSTKLHDLETEAPEQIQVIRSSADLEALLASRRAGAQTVGALFGIEGAHALEGNLANLDELDAAGVRMVGLQHFFDNRLGGSLHGLTGAGLSDFGREVVEAAERKEMIIDLAHSSPAVVDDVLSMATRPVVVSHTGLRGGCDSPRNLSDRQMKRIADAGGLVAIGYWAGAVCDDSPDGVVRMIRYGIELLGEDHIALGSDFDGAVETSFDTSELAVLTDRMRLAGMNERQIRKVMGENTVAFLGRALPQ